MALKARYFWLLASALTSVLSSCAGNGALARGPAREAAAKPAGSPLLTLPVASLASAGALSEEDAPRLFPPLEGTSTLSVGEERDGSERLIAYGLRVLSRPGGALELADQYLPAARSVQSLELPSRLGGGYLFYVLASGTTSTGRRPLASRTLKRAFRERRSLMTLLRYRPQPAARMCRGVLSAVSAASTSAPASISTRTNRL